MARMKIGITQGLARIFSRLPWTAAPYPPADGLVTFQCNICESRNEAVPLAEVQNRECQSCRTCRSSLRMRSIVHSLSRELFGKPVTLPRFPERKDIAGIGMSDWEGYAAALERKLSYTNTYYHTEPRFDITRPPQDWLGKYDFLISSDVFEHVPVFALDEAFANARAVLRPGGLFLLTVPFDRAPATREHFPNLHEFSIREVDGKHVLVNRTRDGAEETFDDLVFHGGEGMTLEMRKFAEPDLRRRLEHAGFTSIRLCDDRVPRFGIDWPTDWDMPFAARA